MKRLLVATWISMCALFIMGASKVGASCTGFLTCERYDEQLVQNGGNPSGVRQSAGDRRMSIGKAWTLCG